MEDNAANELHIVMSHPQSPFRSLPDRCECFREQIVQGLAAGETLPEFGRDASQLDVRKPLHLWLKLIRARNNRLHCLEVSLVLAAQDFGNDGIKHSGRSPAGHNQIQNPVI